MGFIYWIDAAPNPWVRAIAIIVIGGYYYFYADDAVDQSQWIGHWGVCWIDPDNPDNNPRFTDGEPPTPNPDATLFRRLCADLGPVVGTVAFKSVLAAQGRTLCDEEMLRILQSVFSTPKSLPKADC